LKRHPSSFVDLFSSTLEPWIHYVPVKPDLSDVEQMVQYVLNPENEEKMATIVSNANEWCRRHMVGTSVNPIPCRSPLLTIEGQPTLLFFLTDLAPLLYFYSFQTMTYLKSRMVDSLAEFVRRLDLQDKTWTQQWRDKHDKYMVGHWMRQPGSNSWSLPVSIVGGIKGGLRADDPNVSTIWNQRQR
jgi:hypothetical protein